MIRRLRIQFVSLITAVLLLVFASVILTLNLYMHVRSTEQTDRFLEFIAEQDGVPPPYSDPQAPPKHEKPQQKPSDPNHDLMRVKRFFYAKVDESGALLELQHDMMFQFTDADALAYVQSAQKQARDSGTIDNLQYRIAEKSYGSILVFSERSIESQMLEELLTISLWVAGGSSLVLFLLAVLLSKWFVAPVQTAFDKQRQFVSDASHELKTPLTIISAATDVLESESGSHRRLDQIRAQTTRMSGLVQSLLALARTDEGRETPVFHEFDLSRTVLSAALEFESRAFEEGKQFSVDVDSDIRITGNQEKIKQLVGIFLDNAITHSPPSGAVGIALRRQGEKCKLSVRNTGEKIPSSEKHKLFERFYRRDASRSTDTGGYGLGLSIAKAIADEHKWNIDISSKEEGWVEFSIWL